MDKAASRIRLPFYNLVLVNSCVKFTKIGDFVRNWLFFVNYILLALSEKR